MAEFFNGMAIDQPAGTARRNSHAADSWLEPWLIKHVSFYRKHFSKNGKDESHATRRHSVISEALKSRENSVAEPLPDAVVAANAASEEGQATDAMPAPVEEKRRESEEALTEKKSKHGHNWRSNIGWLPHP
ncbi:uncharacterized protein A1O9_03446 [Exophiala aquamarina CBS 119918]|uniref:Uncharacterized protein n=1 Tax=Exophiala aquamarina CBS 119918 TaxID=1182545 RepID=A0A072PP58_9EURO|nr:uncharacterized protein A1O9_03446 [Exophiala aquamarina CBS 119918]KEF61874.1 hypothetical protein A1O9_03446 [Exophiala aquamarina CBS 119918]